MRVREVMTQGVEFIRPTASLQEAALAMRRLGVGMLPVRDQECLLGVLTDRDITVRAVADGCLPEHTRVEDIMTPTVACCYDDQLVIDAALMMQGNQIHRLIVLDRFENPVGVLSLSDLAIEAYDEHLTEITLVAITERVSA